MTEPIEGNKKRRFAFVEIDAPTNKNEEMDLLRERLGISIDHDGFSKLAADEVTRTISPQISKFLDFIFEVRNKRKLGVSTSIDVAKYLAVGCTLNRKKTDHDEDDTNMPWKLLNEALVDYVLPQLDRLDLDILAYVKEASLQNII